MKLLYYGAAIAAMALIASITVSKADEVVSTHCNHNRYSANCQTVYSTVEPRRQTAEELAAEEAEYKKWVGYCQPARYQDALGVYRYRYAHNGCDVGRTSD